MTRQLSLFGESDRAYAAPALQHLPVRERPVNRVAEYGAPACNLVELLAAVVGGARQIEIAHGLLSRFGDVDGIARSPVEELAEVDGLGQARAAALKAALEMGRRLLLVTTGERPLVRSPSDVAQLLSAEMANLEQEHFRVVHLDTRNRVLGIETVYVGSLNATPIRPAEVFRDAIRRNCAAIIAAHNHPSTDPSPSPEDVEITRRLVSAGELLGIELLDHLVIGGQRFVSLRERGLGFAA